MTRETITCNDTFIKVFELYYNMYFSIYRIHTDHGTYVGRTKDFNSRIASHYATKMADHRSAGRPLVDALRTTPDYRLNVEELGYYKVSNRRDRDKIERYWIGKTVSNLNVAHKGSAMFMDDSVELERKSRVDRHPDDRIYLDMKYLYDLNTITYKMKRLTI